MELDKRKPLSALVIVGDGSLRGDLEARCAEYDLKIGSDVIFTGLVDNVGAYLQAMDVLGLPLYFEGFPLATLEAQCTGLRCIVSTNIPAVAAATDLLKRIPMDRTTWIREVEDAFCEYDRRDRSLELAQGGFDTDRFISVLEEMYDD